MKRLNRSIQDSWQNHGYVLAHGYVKDGEFLDWARYEEHKALNCPCTNEPCAPEGDA